MLGVHAQGAWPKPRQLISRAEALTGHPHAAPRAASSRAAGAPRAPPSPLKSSAADHLRTLRRSPLSPYALAGSGARAPRWTAVGGAGYVAPPLGCRGVKIASSSGAAAPNYGLASRAVPGCGLVGRGCGERFGRAMRCVGVDPGGGSDQLLVSGLCRCAKLACSGPWWRGGFARSSSHDHIATRYYLSVLYVAVHAHGSDCVQR